MTTESTAYAARLDIDYPEQLDRVSTAFRLILIIPIVIIFGIISANSSYTTVIVSDTGEYITSWVAQGGGILGALFFATMLMLLFRKRYPRWWFDFAKEFTRFSARVGAYLILMTDQYPSTEDEQTDLPGRPRRYPAQARRTRHWPLVKWFLAIPHYFVLAFLALGAFFVVIIAWFAILFTGRYPRGMFDYLVGVGRWGLRVNAYALLLVTDEYPPFSLS